MHNLNVWPKWGIPKHVANMKIVSVVNLSQLYSLHVALQYISNCLLHDVVDTLRLHEHSNLFLLYSWLLATCLSLPSFLKPQHTSTYASSLIIIFYSQLVIVIVFTKQA